MMNMKKKIITSITAALVTAVVASAQALTGSYFLDNSLMKNRLNPAFTPRANYFGIPAISNLGVGMYGNVGASTFLYPKNGQLYTFLNNNVSVEEFAAKLPKYPGLNLDVNTDILNFGFYTSPKSFWNFDLGVQVNAGVGIPKDFLMLLKQGMAQDPMTYTLDGFNMSADANVYAAIGHSHDLSDYVEGLKVGAKFKFFVSMASIDMDLGKSSMTLSQDKWTVDANATGTIAASFVRLSPSSEPGGTPAVDVDMSKLGPAGYGFAFDLGAEYRLNIGSIVDGLTVSFSALDLGGIFYNSKNVQNLVSEGNASFAGVNGIAMDTDFNGIVDEIKNDFLAIADFKEGPAANARVSTCPKIFAGVEMPFVNDMMSVGLLYSGKFYRRNPINELTLSYNLTPCKWFNFGLNWSFLNSWKTLGWIIEFTPKAGVDFFIGSDYTFFNVMPKIPIPIEKAWTNARFGLNFMIGSKHAR